MFKKRWQMGRCKEDSLYGVYGWGVCEYWFGESYKYNWCGFVWGFKSFGISRYIKEEDV